MRFEDFPLFFYFLMISDSMILIANFRQILYLLVFIPKFLQAWILSLAPSILAFRLRVLAPPIRMVTKSK